jgi:hypothetical protein
MLKVFDSLPARISEDMRNDRRPRAVVRNQARSSSSTCSRTLPIARSTSVRPISTPSAPNGLLFYQPDPATDRFPLALISPSSEKTISSTLGELPGATPGF